MRRFRFRTCAVVFALLLVANGEGQAAKPEGALLLAGGETRADNADVWKRFVDLATRKKETRIVVIPAASGNPQKSGEGAVRVLNSYGAKAEWLPIGPRLPGFTRDVTSDPKLVETVRKATGVWFTGGDQERITAALLEPDGKRTPVLQAIWEIYREGAAIGGTSAGLAIMAEDMIVGGDPLSVLKLGMKSGLLKKQNYIAPGLGFLGKGWLADQHFLVRGRFTRMLYAMHDLDYKYGLGVDEDTAVVYRDDSFEVVGYKGALILDTSEAVVDSTLPEFNIKGAKLTYLNRGYRYRFGRGVRVVEEVKDFRFGKPMTVDPSSSDFAPEWGSRLDMVPDMLGVWAIQRAMIRALDSRAGVVTGLAFQPDDTGAKKDLGFTFKVYCGKGTMGRCTSRGSFESYTIMDIYLDVAPVVMAKPLFKPLE